MKNNANKNSLLGTTWAEEVWGESWTYIKTVVDTAREPFLILDHDLRVVAANESFYRIFQVTEADTENRLVYELGNGQWNNPPLRSLLENILPKETFFKGFEVNHIFPKIGRKVMLLNARQVHKSADPSFPPIILLAIENISEVMLIAEGIAEKFIGNNNEREALMARRTQELEMVTHEFRKEMLELKEEIAKLKNRS